MTYTASVRILVRHSNLDSTVKRLLWNVGGGAVVPYSAVSRVVGVVSESMLLRVLYAT
jgi:hypothetical protein